MNLRQAMEVKLNLPNLNMKNRKTSRKMKYQISKGSVKEMIDVRTMFLLALSVPVG